MANEEKEEIKKIVREELAKLTQPVEEFANFRQPC